MMTMMLRGQNIDLWLRPAYAARANPTSKGSALKDDSSC